MRRQQQQGMKNEQDQHAFHAGPTSHSNIYILFASSYRINDADVIFIYKRKIIILNYNLS